MSEETFTFSKIVVERGNGRNNDDGISPPTLTYDKKNIYIGKSNIRIKHRDLTDIRSTRDLESTHVLLLRDKQSVRCTLHSTSSNNRSADLESFLDRMQLVIRPDKKTESKATVRPPPLRKIRKAPAVTPALNGGFLSRGERRWSSPRRSTMPVEGNVVSDASRKSLKLPPSPPRNATPTKFREEGMERSSVFGRRERALSARKSRRERKLKFLDRLMDFSEDEGESVGYAKGIDSVVTKSMGVDNNDNGLEDETIKEKLPKRKRLIKKISDASNDDSDFEYDDDIVTGAKKKLRLSLEDDEEDEYQINDDPPSLSPMNDAESLLNSVDSDKATDDEDVGKAAPDIATATSEIVTNQPTSNSQSDPPKENTIHKFFQKRTPKPNPVTVERPVTSDTFGACSLSSPLKKSPVSNVKGAESPSTPQESTTKPTPVLKQVQRGHSRYFSNVGNDDTPTRNQLEDVSDEKHDIAGDYDTARQEDTAPKLATSASKGVRPPRTYGRNNNGNLFGNSNRSNSRIGGSKLGQSRLGLRYNDSSPAKRLDFGHVSTADKALESSYRLHSSTKAENDQANASYRPPTIIPGIQNLGNTCYLSASLQTLYNIPQFLRDLYTVYETESIKRKMPLTKSLLEVAAAVGVLSEDDLPKIDPSCARSKLANTKAANASALKKQMDLLTDKFVGYEQRDAHEFLADLVDFLHDELVAEPEHSKEEENGECGSTDKSDQDGSSSDKENEVAIPSHRENSALNTVSKGNAGNEPTCVPELKLVPPTDDYFHLKVRVCLECDSCEYSRSKEEMYRHLSLDVGEDLENGPWTVERGLRQFFQPEKRDLKCEKCVLGTSATQTIQIISCPKALILHFKRFIVTQQVKNTSETTHDEGQSTTHSPVMEMILQKNKARINLECSLAMEPFAEKGKTPISANYHLRGVVHHVGNNAFSGHYTACGIRVHKDEARDKEEWVCFDDRVGVKKDVNYVTLNERNQRNCYIALYELG